MQLPVYPKTGILNSSTKSGGILKPVAMRIALFLTDGTRTFGSKSKRDTVMYVVNGLRVAR